MKEMNSYKSLDEFIDRLKELCARMVNISGQYLYHNISFVITFVVILHHFGLYYSFHSINYCMERIKQKSIHADL